MGLMGLAMLVGAVSYGLSIQLFILALRSLGAARTGAIFGDGSIRGNNSLFSASTRESTGIVLGSFAHHVVRRLADADRKP